MKIRGWALVILLFVGAGAAGAWPARGAGEAEVVLPVGVVQGSGAVSPYLDHVVTLRGVVTGFIEDQNASGIIYRTAFMQDLPGREDGNDATSDGIALFLGQKRPFFKIGDQLRVTGRVTEFYGLTELDDAGLEIVIEAQGVPLPEPIPLSLPAANGDPAAHFERWEGMLVAWSQTALVVGPTHSGCGLAVIDAGSAAERPLRRSRAGAVRHVLPVLHHSDVDCAGFPDAKTGDVIDGLAGPLTYHFDRYKLVQQPGGLSLVEAPLPIAPSPPQQSAGEFAVATVNLENYFDAIDDTGNDAEPKLTKAQIRVRQVKLAHALGHTLGCPTLVGVQEVEKAELLRDLAAQAAEICEFTYTVTHRESVDQRGIDVALLSDPRRVVIESADLRQGCTFIATGITDPDAGCQSGKHPLFSRPPLQVTVLVDGRRYVLFINHFKSKRGGELETAPRRLAQAEHQLALVDDLLAVDAAARIVVMGDLNDVEQSPPLQLLSQRLTNVLEEVPVAERYSYVYGGAAQLIDAILLSPALSDAVTHVQILHVNADFPDGWRADTSPERLPYRATDHDLPLLLLRLPEEETAVAAVVAPPQRKSASPPYSPDPKPAPPDPGSLPPLWGIGLVATAAAMLLWRRRGQRF